MSEDQQYQKFARQFIDAWQAQLSAMMNDSEFIRSLMQMVQPSTFTAKDFSAYDPHAFSHAAEQTRSASAASESRDAALARLAGSLNAIEERLARLERRWEDSAAERVPLRKVKRNASDGARQSKARKRGGKRSTRKSG